jgi:hypothetical protein
MVSLFIFLKSSISRLSGGESPPPLDQPVNTLVHMKRLTRSFLVGISSLSATMVINVQIRHLFYTTVVYSYLQYVKHQSHMLTQCTLLFVVRMGLQTAFKNSPKIF